MQEQTRELKPFTLGLFAAAIAGLLMGAAFRPDLSDDDRPAGPQIMASWTPGQSTGPFDDGGGPVITDWKGPTPAWVVGSDALKAANWLGPAAAPLPDKDLEPLPDAKDLQKIETADAGDAADAATQAPADTPADAPTEAATPSSSSDADQPIPG